MPSTTVTSWTIARGFLVFVRAVGIVSLLLTVATFLARQHWLADLLANLRVQQCIALLLVLTLCVSLRRWRWTAMILICLAIHTPWFIPNSPTLSLVKGDRQRLTITLANVLTTNQHYDDVVAEISSRDPDVIVILELSTPLADVLAQRLGGSYPYSITRPQDVGNFGIGLYSRFPIEDSETFTLNTEIESITAKIRAGNNSYRVFATHPLPPVGDRGYELRNDHLTQLAACIQDARRLASGEPVILVGDLNLTPWSPHFKALEMSSGLRRATDRFKLTPTWYRYPIFPCGLVLDHVLIDGSLVCTQHFVGSDIGSDHRCVTVTLAPAGEKFLKRR